MNTYTQEPQYDERNGYASYDPASVSQPNAFSPSMGSQDFAALLDSFTNVAGTGNDDFTTGLFSQSSTASGYPTESDMPQYKQSAYQNDFANSAGLASGYSPTSNGQFSYAQEPFQASMGLGIKSTQPQQHDQYPHTYAAERPDHQTVPYLEAMAAAPAMQNNQTGYGQYEGSASSLSRQNSSRSLLDGPHLASLSLNSPRHSISATSSAPSSAQTSPTTPMSAYSYDGAGVPMQHQYSQQSDSQYNGYHQYAIYSSPYNATQNGASCNPLSMSMPASLSSQGMRAKSSFQQLPNGRLSSAGLMEQIVNSRRVTEESDMNDTAAPIPKETRLPRSRANSKSKKSPTPPATPGRSNLRMSIGAGELASGLATIQSGHSTPTSEGAQPSSAGPHRTPSKRHLVDGNVQATVPILGGTPKRPASLRRTHSHTPASGNKEASPAIAGLASPADFESASVRAQSAAQSAIASAVQPAQKARLADSADLEFQGSSSGMSRARSSPGMQLSTSLSRQGLTLDAVLSPNALSRSRRGTNPGLQMSPLNATFNGSTGSISAASSPGRPVSFAEALLALDQISMFLNYQATLISSDSRQTAATVLGSYEQLQSVEDIRRRIQCQLSGPF